MNMISQIRRAVIKDGEATINTEQYNQLQAEWITRCAVDLPGPIETEDNKEKRMTDMTTTMKPLGKALLILSFYMMKLGLALIFISCILMIGFAIYELLFTAPATSNAEHFSRMAPTWRVDMLMVGMLISTLSMFVGVGARAIHSDVGTAQGGKMPPS